MKIKTKKDLMLLFGKKRSTKKRKSFYRFRYEVIVEIDVNLSRMTFADIRGWYNHAIQTMADEARMQFTTAKMDENNIIPSRDIEVLLNARKKKRKKRR